MAPEVTVFTAGDEFEHPRCLATERYQSSLHAAKAHEFRCGENGAYRDSTVSRAEYVTERAGTVVVTSSGYSPLHLWCSRSSDCDVTIAH